MKRLSSSHQNVVTLYDHFEVEFLPVPRMVA